MSETGDSVPAQEVNFHHHLIGQWDPWPVNIAFSRHMCSGTRVRKPVALLGLGQYSLGDQAILLYMQC